MSEMIETKVSKEDLYHYCKDFGLMLSWGIPIINVLKEMEKSQENFLLGEVNRVLYEKLICGSNITGVLEKYPSVFKPAFLKWIRVGEKFGLLDGVMLQIAGLLRFDSLLERKDPFIASEEIGTFLRKTAEFLKASDKDLTAASLRNFTDNLLLLEWLEKISGMSGEKKIFNNSQRNYLVEPVYRKIASPLFWHLLDTAETCGYLPSMLEILGLYLTDKNNLFPSGETVTVERKSFTDSFFKFPDEILELLEKSRDKKFLIKIKEHEVTFLIDGKVNIPDSIKDSDREIKISLISSLKIFFDLDVAEKCLPQKNEKDYNGTDRKYRIFINIIPPYGLPGEGPKETDEGTEIIEIELKGI